MGPAACCREVHRVYVHGSAGVAVKVAQKGCLLSCHIKATAQ